MGRNEEGRRQKFGSQALEVHVNAPDGMITLHGDLTGAYETKIRLSQALSAAAGTSKWTIDADDIRFDEAGVVAWAEYVQLLLMDSTLTYRPSQLGTLLYFDDGLVYKHTRSQFEGV